ncbi:serpin family protein [Halobacteria archaeon AArc-dxtr1]|nr:serpin family protein [Halobacteria archaeon AArc-dxtr1]
MELSRRTAMATTGAALAGGALWYAMSGAEAEPAVEPIPGITAASDAAEAAVDAVVEGNVEFGVELLNQLVDDDPNENLVASPASVGLALGMTHAGAQGETEAQIADAMRFPDDQDDLHPAHQHLQYELNQRAETAAEEDATFELAVANAVWGLEEYPYSEAYLDLLEERYGAELDELDFAGDSEGAREEINDWVAERTNDHIDELFPAGAFDQYTRLVLTNAVYLLADWHHQFDEGDTRDEPFTTLDGEERDVPLMRQTQTFPYAEVDGHQAIELPYIGEEVSMLVLLPAEGEFESFEADLDADQLGTFTESLSEGEGQIVLPRFEFDVAFSLNGVLADLGMPGAFEPDEANFDGMTDGDNNLFVGEVVHEAYVAVDEEGTEAAAATGVEMVEDSGPALAFDMIVDRPFLFLIRDRETGAVLFLGRVVDPKE